MKTALLIVHFFIVDPEALQIYKEQVKPTLMAYKVQPLTAGPHQLLLGDSKITHTSIFRFPNKEAVNQWFSSKEYQELKTIRDKAIKAEFIVIEE